MGVARLDTYRDRISRHEAEIARMERQRDELLSAGQRDRAARFAVSIANQRAAIARLVAAMDGRAA